MRRVDDRDRVGVVAVLEDEDAPQRADLRAREADAVRVVHQVDHPRGERAHVVVDLRDLARAPGAAPSRGTGGSARAPSGAAPRPRGRAPPRRSRSRRLRRPSGSVYPQGVVRPLLLTLLAASSSPRPAAARNPRLEQLALRPVDTELARNAVAPRRRPRPAGARTDRSRGRRAARLREPGLLGVHDHRPGAVALRRERARPSLSRVEVYREPGGGARRLRASTRRPGTAACEGAAIRAEVARRSKGVTVRLGSARQLKRAEGRPAIALVPDRARPAAAARRRVKPLRRPDRLRARPVGRPASSSSRRASARGELVAREDDRRAAPADRRRP